MNEPLKKPEPDTPTPQIVRAPDYLTRAKLETAMGALRDDLKTHIDGVIKTALQDMREMLGQSLKANSDQREMINATLSTIQASIAETIAARDAQIQEVQRDVNDLEKASTQAQLAITKLATETTTTTKDLDRFIKTINERDVAAVKHRAQLEGRIEDNRIWIERRRRIEKNLAALARPVLQLPRWAKLAAFTVLATSGAQWQLDWINSLMDLFR